MQICLLTTQDLDADPFPEDDWPCDPRPFMPEATWTVATLTGKANSVKQVETLIDSGKYDLFFNLCDGAADQDLPGIEVIQKLEERQVPYAGACSKCYEPTRVEMKEACAKIGIATPNYVVAKTPKTLKGRPRRELSLVCEAPQQLRQCRLEPSIPVQSRKVFASKPKKSCLDMVQPSLRSTSTGLNARCWWQRTRTIPTSPRRTRPPSINFPRAKVSSTLI